VPLIARVRVSRLLYGSEYRSRILMSMIRGFVIMNLNSGREGSIPVQPIGALFFLINHQWLVHNDDWRLGALALIVTSVPL
jgi:hypothetical protein